MCAVVCVHVLVSLLASRSFGLTAFGDLTQCVLLLCGTLAIASNIGTSHKKAQFFWALMALGCRDVAVLAEFYGADLLQEVYLRQEVPNPFVGDVILFLHIVPMMAALAVQPHIDRNEHSLRLVSLDFVLLLTWWLYLYLFIVIPWQYVSPDEGTYGNSFDLLYACEQIVLIVGAGLVWKRSQGAWRTIYGPFVKAAVLYSVGSIVAGVAIDFHLYYTGSLYDVPLVTAMALFAVAGVMGRKSSPERLSDQPPSTTTTCGPRVWQ